MKKMIIPMVLAVAISFPGIADDMSGSSSQSGSNSGQQQSGSADDDMLSEEQQSAEEQRIEREKKEKQQAAEEQAEEQQVGEEVSGEQQSGEDSGIYGGEQQSQQQQQAGQQQVTDFQKSMALNKIHHVNQKEIEMANVALENAQSPEVKQLAREVIADHQASDQKLQELAKTENVSLSDYKAAGYEQASLDELKKLKGPQFDQAFSKLSHQSHQSTAQELQMISQDIKDPEVKQFVSQLVPKIRQHSQRSQQMSG